MMVSMHAIGGKIRMKSKFVLSLENLLITNINNERKLKIKRDNIILDDTKLMRLKQHSYS